MTKARAKILVVDDETNIREALAALLAADGYQVAAAASAEEAMQALRHEACEVVLADMRLQGKTGLDLLRWTKESYPATEIILITAYGSVEDAVEAMKLGAYDYLSKPVDRRRLALLIEKALEKYRLSAENRSLRRRLSVREEFSHIIGNSPRLREIFTIVAEVAPTNATVLITGESGTGKELVARAIHNRSRRREGPFITLNCGALPDTLLESELFGYEKGAFTGATSAKMGRIEMAHQGTLFLDEVGDMTPKTQVDLLRVLQERELRRLGGSRTVHVDVRFIAATNKDLESEIEKKGFREDLYYRLNVVPIPMPPLRERREDIPLLIESFLREFCTLHKKDLKKIDGSALDALLSHSWPGNVRELRNLVERLVLLSKSDTVQPQDLPAAIRGTPSHSPGITVQLDQPMSEIEKEVIQGVLEKVTANRRKAAELLGISLRALQYKIKKYRPAEPGE